MPPQIFLIRNTVVSYLLLFKKTDTYFVNLLYILQSVCAGEFSGHSNYSKPYGHGQQLINGLQFFSRPKKSSLPCFREIWGLDLLTLTYFIFTRNCSCIYIDISHLACTNKGHQFRLEPGWSSSVSIKYCQFYHLLIGWFEYIPLPLTTNSTCKPGPSQRI